MKQIITRSVALFVCVIMVCGLFATTFTAAPVVSAAESEPVNLLVNGDFEKRSTIPGWDIGSDVNVNLAHGDAKTGELALSMKTANASVPSAAVSVYAGRTYTASVYVKGAAGAQITLRFYDASGAVIGSEVAATTAETTDWTELAVTKAAPAAAAKADVLLSTTAACTGTVLFDDAILDQSVQPTSIIVNGDFENGVNSWSKGYGGTVSTEDKSATDTNKVLKVDSVMNTYTTLYQKNLAATAGDTFVLSFDYKLNLTQRKDATIMVRLQFRDSADARIGSDYDFYADKVNVQDWKAFSAEVTAPEGTVTVDITVWIYSDNEGECWVDNVALTPKASDSLSNTSFEDVASVPNWTISGSGDKQLAVDGVNVNAGNGALYIKDNSTTPVNVLSDAVAITDNQIGHEISLSYYVLGLGPKEGNGMVNATTPSIFINFYDENGSQLASSTRVTCTGAYPHWSQRTKTGVVPEGAKTFKVWIAYGSTTIGDVLIDDITVTMLCDHDSLTYTEVSPADCDGPGEESAFCNLCQQNITRDIPQLEHDWDDGVVKSPASCDQTGVKTYTCGLCGDTKDDDYPATGHTLTAVPANPASATQDGNTAYWTCTCGKWFTDADGEDEIYDKTSVVIPATGGNTSGPQEPDKTGDSTAVALMFTVMIIAGFAVITAKFKFTVR